MMPWEIWDRYDADEPDVEAEQHDTQADLAEAGAYDDDTDYVLEAARREYAWRAEAVTILREFAVRAREWAEAE